MCFFFSWMFFTASRKLHLLMMIIIVVSFCAEICGSKILTLYQYHLDNIPLFIPLGHSVVYAIVYQMSKTPFIWNYHRNYEAAFYKLAFIICSISLVLLHDIAGYFCYLIFLFFVKRRKKPLFYLMMFSVTYYLEFLGTVSSAWSYYYVLDNHPYYPPTSITPCGIAGIYTFMDITSNNVYLYIKQFKKYARRALKVRSPSSTKFLKHQKGSFVEF